MTKQFFKDSFGWGFILWLIGYILGIVFFMTVPNLAFGWIIMPIGTAITIWVLLNKVKPESLKRYILLGFIWMSLAIIFDYIFNVKMFNITNYYKLDIYVYYIITLALPIIIGLKKISIK